MSLPSAEQAMAFIAPFEGGHRARVYSDSRGIPTVAVGFNLRRPDAAGKLAALGYNLARVENGIEEITEAAGRQLFRQDVEAAIREACALSPAVPLQPRLAQLVLVDLVYNLGASRLAGFAGFLRAFGSGRYALAGLELVFSQLGRPGHTGYWTQTKTRAAHHASVLGSLDKLAR